MLARVNGRDRRSPGGRTLTLLEPLTYLFTSTSVSSLHVPGIVLDTGVHGETGPRWQGGGEGRSGAGTSGVRGTFCIMTAVEVT